VAIGILAASSAAFGAGTAVIARGKVTGERALLNPVWNEAKESGSHRYGFRQPSPTVAPEARALTAFLPRELCVVALGDKGTPNPLALRVLVVGGRTAPVTLVVAEGQQIQFENRDPFPHRLHDRGGKGLNAVDMLPGKTRAWTPPGPGKYEIRDELAPSVRSWIVVEPRTVAIAYPNRKGEFAIQLEPGDYKLRGYFNGEPVGQELPITVSPAADQPLKTPLVVGETPQSPGDKP
jgi:hypothetical protein